MPARGIDSIRVRLIGLVGLLSAIGILLQPVPASSASWLPPRTVYIDAVQRLIWTSGFDMTTSVSYPAGTARGGIAYRAPQRLRSRTYQGPQQGEAIRVQVQRTSCGWWTGKTFRRILCGYRLWDDGFVAQQATTLLLAGLLPRAVFTRATSAADNRQGIVRIAIAAPESPSLCAPWLQCPSAGYNSHGRYHGTLLVSSSSGLPLSFTSTITLRGLTFTFQRVSFTYRHLKPVKLPGGHHIRCPSRAAGQWCLARK